MTERCDTCKFWKRRAEVPVSVDADLHPDDRRGQCHRYAPPATVGDYQYNVVKFLSIIAWSVATEKEKETDFKGWEEAHLDFSSWPATTGSDWCGEWRQQQEDTA